MLTDPVDDREIEEAAEKSSNWGFLPIHNPIARTMTQERYVFIDDDSTRIKTVALTGKRYAY